MSLLQEEDVAYLREAFAPLTDEVTLTLRTKQKSMLVVPGSEPEPEDGSQELRTLAREVAATSPKLKLVEENAEDGERVPSLTFSTAKSLGRLRYYGLPAGYEMSTVVAAISDLGSGQPVIPEDVREKMAALKNDVHIQVFVTPS